VERAGAAIDEGAEIAPGAGEGGGLLRAEIVDGGEAALPLLGAAFGALDGGWRMQALNPGGALRLGCEPVAGDEVEDEIGGAAGEAPETFAALAPEHRLDLVWIVFEAGDDLPAIASRCAPARRLGIEGDDADSRFGEMQRSREAEIAGADDENVRLEREVERRGRRRGDRGLFPEIGVAARHPPAHHRRISSSAG
jgi:hypothetical protein